MIILKCKTCSNDFEVSQEMIDFQNSPTQKIHLEAYVKYCPSCRQKRIKESIKHLPTILKILSN